MRRSATCLVLLAAAGCNAPPPAAPPQPVGQTFPQAVSMMCDVDRLAGLAPEEDPIGAGTQRTAWIQTHVENPDAIELRTYMSVKGAAEQAEMLRCNAKEVGLKSCRLADSLEQHAAGGLSP
jgi:hypothetical protein